MSDIDGDGRFTAGEFVLAMFLIYFVVELDQSLPNQLPDFLKPKSFDEDYYRNRTSIEDENEPKQKGLK